MGKVGVPARIWIQRKDILDGDEHVWNDVCCRKIYKGVMYNPLNKLQIRLWLHKHQAKGGVSASTSNPEKGHTVKWKKSYADHRTGALDGKGCMIQDHSEHSMEECKVLANFWGNGHPRNQKKT